MRPFKSRYAAVCEGKGENAITVSVFHIYHFLPHLPLAGESHHYHHHYHHQDLIYFGGGTELPVIDSHSTLYCLLGGSKLRVHCSLSFTHAYLLSLCLPSAYYHFPFPSGIQSADLSDLSSETTRRKCNGRK